MAKRPEILTIRQSENDLVIVRERPTTKAERERNQNAVAMVETINVHFTLQSPRIVVDRTFTGE